MTNKIVLLSELKDSKYRILSPTVGSYSAAPQNGAALIGGSFAGKLKVRNIIYNLHIPDETYGTVIVNPELDKVAQVEYGQELFSLNPEKTLVDTEQQHIAESGGHTAGQEEGFVIAAHTDGIFYRKPSPDAPAFIEVGDRIEKGKTLGLIEVMKSFNYVLFNGTDTSDTGTISKIYVKDSQEVKSGEPLMLIKD